jgi:hypothetical protein
MAHDELKVVGELNADDIRLHSDRWLVYIPIIAVHSKTDVHFDGCRNDVTG